MARFVQAGSPKDGETLPGGRPPRPVSPLTVRHVRATLRRALADAVRDGRVGRNAAADARPPYVPHRPVGHMSAPDVRRLLDATRDDPLGPIFALAALTGFRLGELLGFAWPDVDFAAGTLTVRRSLARGRTEHWELAQPKTATSRRTIPLPSIARDALERQKTIQETERKAAGKAPGRTATTSSSRTALADMSNLDPCLTAFRTLAKPLDCRRPGSMTFATRPRR
jgi:integrase